VNAVSRTIRAIGAALLALGAAGCTMTRALAPWLRIHEHTPFELLAEAGSGPHGHWAWVDRKVGGRWVVVPEADAIGFSFSKNTRVVVGNILLTQDGRTIPLPCPHTGRIGDGLRAAPNGGLVCVTVRGAFENDVAKEELETVSVIRFDDDGIERGRSRVSAPLKRPLDASPLSIDIDTSFVGFLGDELVFAVLNSWEHESWATEEWKHADAWALTIDGHWRKLGPMRFQVGDIWRIHAAACWSAALGLAIDTGRHPQGANGRPHWSSCD
jgi:hypothetical protein